MSVDILVTFHLTYTFFCFLFIPAINGYIFGTMPPLRQSMMTWTDFHLMSVGTQQDIHVPHISNMILETEAIDGSERRMDGVPLYPGASIMVYDHKIGIMTPGNWLIRCAINEHFQAGMMAMWEVTNPCKLLSATSTSEYLNRF